MTSRGLTLGGVVLVHAGFIYVMLVATHFLPAPMQESPLVMAKLIAPPKTKDAADTQPKLTHMLAVKPVDVPPPDFQIATAAPAPVPHEAGARAITIGPPQPISVSCAIPTYPPEAKRLGETGAVAIALYISKAGKVLKTRIAHSSGFSSLDTAAENALAQCDFMPGTKAGKPVESWTTLRYVWQLD